MKLEDIQKAQDLHNTLADVRAKLGKIRGLAPHTVDVKMWFKSGGTSWVDVHLTFEEARLATMLAISALESQEREMVARLKDLGVEA
jgi:hypothetical protein